MLDLGIICRKTAGVYNHCEVKEWYLCLRMAWIKNDLKLPRRDIDLTVSLPSSDSPDSLPHTPE